MTCVYKEYEIKMNKQVWVDAWQHWKAVCFGAILDIHLLIPFSNQKAHFLQVPVWFLT